MHLPSAQQQAITLTVVNTALFRELESFLNSTLPRSHPTRYLTFHNCNGRDWILLCDRLRRCKAGRAKSSSATSSTELCCSSISSGQTQHQEEEEESSRLTSSNDAEKLVGNSLILLYAVKQGKRVSGEHEELGYRWVSSEIISRNWTKYRLLRADYPETSPRTNWRMLTRINRQLYLSMSMMILKGKLIFFEASLSQQQNN